MHSLRRLSPSISALLLVAVVALPAETQRRSREAARRPTRDTTTARIPVRQPTAPVRTPDAPNAAVVVAPGNATEVQGGWEGVYHVYPQVMRIRLDLRDAGDGIVEGEVRHGPLEDGATAGRFGQAPATYQVRGRYDAAGGLELEPAQRVQPAAGVRPLPPLRMVRDARSNALAGVLSTQSSSASPFFVLVREGAAGDRLFEPAAEAASSARPGRGGGLPFGGGADRDKILAWAARLRTEYPEMDPYRTEMGTLWLRARNLFEDKHFEAHFGTTYDRMSGRQRSGMERAFRMDQRAPQEMRSYAALGAAFRGIGTYSLLDMTVSVLAMRTLRAWRDDALARLATLEASADAFERIAAAEQAAAHGLVLLWPSEQAAFAQAVAGARERLAAPVLTASVDALIASSSGYEGAVALSGWESSRATLLSYVPAETRQALATRVEHKLDAVLTPLVAEETAKLARLGSGAAAVDAGNAWLAGFSRRYAFAANRPVVRAAVGRLQERRAADLAAAQPVFAARFASQSSTAAVDNALQAALAVPGDHATQAGRALIEAAQERKAALDRVAYLAFFSPQERRLLGEDRRVRVPAAYGAPGEEELRRAILRGFVDAGGRWIDANTVTYGWSFFMGQFDYYVRVPRIEIASISPGPPYEVSLRAHLSLEMSPEMEGFLGETSPQSQLLRGMLALIDVSRPEVLQHAFLLTPQGWKSPSFTLDVAASNFSFMKPLMER